MAFPPPGAAPAGAEWGNSDEEQARFDAFKPDAEPEKPKEEPPPTPQVRNGKVLLLVLTAAALLLAVPLGTLWLLGKVGQPGFNPDIGSCVRNSNDQPVAAACDEEGAYSVVSKVDDPQKCPDPAQPHVTLSRGGSERVLCLKPASDAG